MVETVNDPKVGTLFVEQGAEPLVMDLKGLKDFMTLKTRNGPGSSRRSASSRCEGHTRLDLPRLKYLARALVADDLALLIHHAAPRDGGDRPAGDIKAFHGV